MKRAYMLIGIAVALLLCGCSQTPGPVYAKTSVQQPVFDATGLRLRVAVECQRTIKPWYASDASIEPAACPKKFLPAEVWVRTPWGQVYRGSVSLTTGAPGTLQRLDPGEHGAGAGLDRPARSTRSTKSTKPDRPEQPAQSAQPAQATQPTVAGVLAIKIDWPASGVDPHGSPEDAGLHDGWVIFSKDGQVNVSLALSSGEIRKLLAAIVEAFANDDAAGRAEEHAKLTAKLSNEPDAPRGNRIILSVTNEGPDPAYKVVAQLRSSLTAIHGLQQSFGRINPGETRSRIAQISGLTDADDLNATIVATVSSVNAAPAMTSSRLRLASAKVPHPAPLQLSCAALDRELAAGQRLRVQCESVNPDGEPVRGVSFQVAVGTAAASPAGISTEFAPHSRFKFELMPTLPANAKTGASVPVTITMNAPDAAPVQQQVAIRIIEASGTCKQGKLARDAYRSKRKRMLEALASSALTEKEFTSYDIEMISCLE